MDHMFSKSRLQEPYYLAGLLALLLLFLTSIQFRELFYANQNEYYLHGLIDAGGEFAHLRTDWIYAHGPVKHIVFYYLVRTMAELGVLTTGTWVLELALTLVLFVTLGLLVQAFIQKFAGVEGLDPAVLFLVLFALVVLLWAFVDELDRIAFDLVFLRPRFSSVADQYLFGGYLQPSEFGVLGLTGLYMAHRQRWYATVLLFAAASIFHVGLFAVLSVMLGVMLLWLFAKAGKRWLAIRLGLLFTALTLPLVIWASGSDAFFGAGELAAAGQQILIYERLPHHTVPATWLREGAAANLLMVALAAVVMFVKTKGPLRWMMAVGLAFALVAIVVAWRFEVKSIMLLMPWRILVFLVPIAIVLLTVFVGLWGLRVLRKAVPSAWLAAPWPVALAVVAGVLFQVAHFRVSPANNDPSLLAGLALARSNSEPDDIFMIPSRWVGSEWNDFRLAARRPVYFEEKFPAAVPYMVEWWARRATVQAFYRLERVTQAEHERMCEETKVDYYFFAPEDNDLTPVATRNGLGMYAC